MPRVIYLHGFASGPGSRKARFFRDRLMEAGRELEAPDLTGGDFEHLTIGGQLRVLEELVGGEAVRLIGSSLGGYLAALYAGRHPETERLLLLAPAFGFAERWPDMVGEQAFEQWRSTGRLSIYHYAEGGQRNLGFQICEESRQWPPYPEFPQPAQIFHGENDTVVFPEVSVSYAAGRPNVALMLLDSDHELIDALPEIWSRAADFLLD